MERSTKIALAVALLLMVFLGQAALFTEAVADGWYDLTVEIAPESSKDVKSVDYLAVGHPEQADAVLANIASEIQFMEHHEGPDSFVVSTGFSYREWMGIKHHYVQQFSDIVVVLNHSDGSREVHRSAIPDRKVSKHIVVDSQSRTRTVE